MEWVIIWLLVQAEQIAKFFEYLDNFLILGVFLVAIRYIAAACVLDSYTSAQKAVGGITMASILKADVSQGIKKVSIWVIGVALAADIASALIPSQRNMAIIVGSGVAYNAITSETGKRLSNKGVQLLEKKIDEILKDEEKPKPQVKEAPASTTTTGV